MSIPPYKIYLATYSRVGSGDCLTTEDLFDDLATHNIESIAAGAIAVRDLKDGNPLKSAPQFQKAMLCLELNYEDEPIT